MATLLTQYTIADGCIDRFEASQRTMYRETLKGDHVRLYQSFRSANPREYYTLMSFDDYVAFIRHISSDHHEDQDALSMIEAIRFHWLEPLEGASDFGPTIRREFPDPTPLQQRYLEMFRFDRAGWWPAT